VRQTLADAREYLLSVQVQDVRLDAGGRRATVTANVSRVITPRRLVRVPPTTTPSIFTLEKVGDTWIIRNLAAR
jgi:hypothetical protein